MSATGSRPESGSPARPEPEGQPRTDVHGPGWQRTLRAAVAERKAPSAWALALAVAGAVLIERGTPLWWLGASFWVGAALCVHHGWRAPLAAASAWALTPRRLFGRTLAVGPVLLELTYMAILIWVATVMMRDVFYGARPISHDHTVHYVKAYQLHEHFLPNWRLHGYSHRWFAGYPVDYLYPIGTDLFVNLVHALGLGLMRFSQSYGIAFWLFHVLTGIAGYRFGRLVGGPHVGLITGFLMITDMSSFRFGGWAYTIEFGVWPQALSLIFALFATERVPEIYAGRSWKPVGWFALWMGASIVTHPIEFLYLAVLLLCAVLAGIFNERIKTAAGTLRLSIAFGLSALCASAWLLPFLESRDQTTPMGVWWDSTYEMGRGLIGLNGFPGTLGWVIALGCFGVLVALRSRNFVLMLTAALSISLPLLSGSTLIDELHLPSLSAAFAKVQWLRMSTMAKPFWFALAAYFAVAAVQRALELGNLIAARASLGVHGRQRLSATREVLLGMVIAFFTLPIVVPAAQSFYTSNILKALQTETDRQRDPDRAALVAWLVRNLPKGDGFYRLCINTGHNHDLLDLTAELPVPIYKRGFTPAENFILKMNIEDPAVLEAVNVRFMVVKKLMPPEDYEELAVFGIYRVYRFKRWQPNPFVISQGEGEVRVERFSDHEIVLEAAPGSHGKLRLNVSYFPRWHAYRDGKPIQLWKTALREAPLSTGFMTVWLEPGTYRFAFELSALDSISALLSVLGCALAALMIVSDGRLAARARLPSLLAPLSIVVSWLERLSAPQLAGLRRASLAVLAFGAVASWIALSEWTPPLVLENLGDVAVKRVRFDFLEELSRARAQIEYRGAAQRCRRMGDRHICRSDQGVLDNDKYVASTPAEIEEYRMVRCIRFRPEEFARLVMVYRGVPAGEAIVGYYGVERAGRLLRLTRPVDFRVSVDGRPVHVGSTQADNKMHWFRADVGGGERLVDVSFEVSAANIAKRFFCFYAQMADLKPVDPTARPGVWRSLGEDDGDWR